MPNEPLHVLAVVGSMCEKSATRTVLLHAADDLRSNGCVVDVLDLHAEQLPLFNPETTYRAAHYPALTKRLEQADVFLLATPDYHGSVSGALKNFLDHGWKEFTGKLFATIVGSFEKGLTVHDQLRTVARQCYAWSMPYGVSFVEKEDLKDGQIVTDTLKQRLEMLSRDVRVYGRLLAHQRRSDIAGRDTSFLARQRK